MKRFWTAWYKSGVYEVEIIAILPNGWARCKRLDWPNAPVHLIKQSYLRSSYEEAVTNAKELQMERGDRYSSAHIPLTRIQLAKAVQRLAHK